MNKTKIEWVENPDGTQGYTWNPITGCNNQIDGMCQGGNFPCYAYRLANGRLRNRYLANKHTATHNYDEDSYPFYPRFWEDRLNEPLHKVGKPLGIFPCDMSDLFGIGIPEEWTRRVLSVIRACSSDRFYLLTKQPQRLPEFSPFLDNCWVGVTATNSSMFAEACYQLKKIDAKVKYVSLEPLLDFEPAPDVLTWSKWICDWLKIGGIGQVIIGAQTKPYKPPKIEWVEEIVNAADKAGVPVFLKNNLEPLLLKYPYSDLLWEDLAHLRQEIPVEIPLNK